MVVVVVAALPMAFLLADTPKAPRLESVGAELGHLD
jgi:hypothetical protein